MSAERVTTIEDVLAGDGDGRALGLACPSLAQEIWRLEPGGRRRHRLDGRSGVLFAFAGSGVLRRGGDEHPLGPETGAFVEADAEFEVEADGDTALLVVLVATPRAVCTGERAVSFGDVESESAGIGRHFRLLAQSSEATQFVGLVPPGRAKMHNHPYDELACVLEGEGVLHWHEGPSIPVGRGSLIYFPRLVFHSLENAGSDTLRIMGVFHPAGSPADRVDVLDY